MEHRHSLVIPPHFDGNNYAYWKVRMKAFLKSIDERVWNSVEYRWEKPTTPVSVAESGSLRALTNLAYLYYEGEGVARDPVTAYSWFEIAATYGEPVGQTRVNFASKLTSAEIEQAQQRARQWISQHGAAFRDLPFRSPILARTDNQR